MYKKFCKVNKNVNTGKQTLHPGWYKLHIIELYSWFLDMTLLFFYHPQFLRIIWFFVVHFKWNFVKDLISNCYFCLTDVSVHTSKNKCFIEYPNLPWASKVLPHSEDLPVPERPDSWNLQDDAQMHSDDTEIKWKCISIVDKYCKQPCITTETQTGSLHRWARVTMRTTKFRKMIYYTQADLNDLILYETLNLYKNQAVSLFQITRWNLFFCCCCNCEKKLEVSFPWMVIYPTVKEVELVRALWHKHKPKYWWLFIDSSKINPNAVLHNGNHVPSKHVANVVHREGSYEYM